MKNLILMFCILVVAGSVLADDNAVFEPLHRVNTYSIVCYDSASGQFGAAVQSHWFKVGDVIWAEPGVGAVATQSLADFTYGHLGLEMLKMGKSPVRALAGLIESDPNSDVRQVAIIDKDTVAVHTGSKCIAEAGHYAGHHYSVQANLMQNNTVWKAMADAYESTQGDLAERMMAALEAAQAEGGDIRGKQSAAMIVVRGEPTGQSWRDHLVDLRVDDSPTPLVELRRLLNINRAYDFMNAGDEYLAEGKLVEAQEAYEMAATLIPGNVEILFWYAATLVEIGEVERSLPVFKKVFEADSAWREVVPRLVKAELLPDDDDLISLILAQ